MQRLLSALASLLLGGYAQARGVLLSYVVLFLCLSPSVRMIDMARRGDLSYGIYIYAFPIGQATFVLLPRLGPWGLIAITLPVALLFAVLSWTLIESPALSHRHRLAAWARRRRAEKAPDSA